MGLEFYFIGFVLSFIKYLAAFIIYQYVHSDVTFLSPYVLNCDYYHSLFVLQLPATVNIVKSYSQYSIT